MMPDPTQIVEEKQRDALIDAVVFLLRQGQALGNRVVTADLILRLKAEYTNYHFEDEV